MIGWLVVAAMVTAGVPPALVAVVATAFVHPGLFLLGAAGWGLWRHRWGRRRNPDPAAREAAVLRAMAAELERGASLRSAVVEADAVGDVPLAARLAIAGRPAPEVAAELRSAFPVNGVLVGAAYQMASEVGGPVAGLFRRLADRAEDVADTERERRAATAQARLSALVVSLAPVGVVALLATSGRLSGLLEAGAAGAGILAVGGGLLLAGAVAAAVVTRTVLR